MTNVHAEYKVPSTEMDEIPIDNCSSRTTSTRPMRNSITTGEYQRRLDAENYWNYVIRHRFAVVLGVLFIATVLGLIGIIVYFVITPGKNYAEVVIDKVLTVEYPRTEKSMMDDEFEERIGSRTPVINIVKEFSDDKFDDVYREAYKYIPNEQMIRMKREVEMENEESCKERHESCKIVLSEVKKMTKNISQQVHQLKNLMNKIAAFNDEEIPTLNNITALDFVKCLKCEKLENKTLNVKSIEISTLNSTKIDSQNQSLIDNSKIYTTTITTKDTFSENSKVPLISTTSFPIQSTGEKIDGNQSNVSFSVELNNSTSVDNSSGLTTPPLTNFDTIVQDESNTTGNSVNYNVEEEKLHQTEVVEDTIKLLDDLRVQDKDKKFFAYNQSNNTTLKPEIENLTDKSKTLESELDSVTTEDSSTILAALIPANDDARSMSNSDSINLEYSPQSKSNVEPNPFVIPTAETTKTSQQMTYTPSITWMPYPLCVYGSPSSPQSQTVRQSTSDSITFPVTFSASSSTPVHQIQHDFQSQDFPTPNGGTFNYNFNFVQPNHPIQPMTQPVQFVPVQSSPVPSQRFGPSGPGVQYFPVVSGNPQPATTGQARPFYCTYLPTPTFQFPVIPGVSEFQRAATTDNKEISDVSNVNELNHIDEQELKSRDFATGCPPNTRACRDRSDCIPKLRWCDGRVDCSDASDETHCSCRDRVDRERLCDGYFDCPLGEDELGCFGCDKNSFSCDDSERHQRWGNCLPIVQRCDGYPQCSNGKDELHCNIITHSVEQREMFTVGYTTGYLHRNWRGKWYPACTAVSTWASDACRAEIGDNNYRDFPTIEPVYLQQNYNGPYAVQRSFDEIEIVNSCSGKAVFVKCPEIPCGTRVSSPDDNLLPYSKPLTPIGYPQVFLDVLENFRSVATKEEEETIEDDSYLVRNNSMSQHNKTVMNSTNNNDNIVSSSRVVGGHPSRPQAWPSLVAINRDGNFHCGGAIIDEFWILTAAHCVDGYRQHYYDIQAGMLRRFSYSPMEQARKVTHVVMYPTYDRSVMKNDIALLKLEAPLYFNRWVRAACLPEISTAGPHWRAGPSADTTCISAGWGSTVEHGPDPDHLREVELPILPNCKHPDDQNEAELCAGSLQGGRDTCQGDSGGPLMCRNPNSPSQWYVAGIVSHGEGCARPNEPGAYTKVGRFVEWINEMRSQYELPKRGPLARCPGYYCHSGSHRCYPAKRRCDKTVDCLDAEDELNCKRFNDFSSFKSAILEDNVLSNENPEEVSTTTTATTKEINNDETTTTTTESTTTVTSTNTNVLPTTTFEVITSTTEVSTVQPTTIQSTEQSISFSDTTVISDENFTTNSPVDETNNILPPTERLHFSCKNLLQTIDIKKVCDKIIDCQDGTDEENCTCRDYLTKINPASICDGHVDCLDKSDEENCEICSPEEFHCKRSGECLPLSKQCDRKGDCQFNEDELYCLTLTNGKYVITDIDGIPHHKSEGILTSYEKGKWVPFCIDRRADKPATLGKQMCSYFGFGACESFNETRMQNAPLDVKVSTSKNLIPYEYTSLQSLITDDEPRCTTLYIRCVPTIHTVPLTYRVKGITDDGEDTFLWPWHAAVFVDGRYTCSAVLLESSWLLTSSYCAKNVNLNQNYTVALLGISRSYLHVDGPHQQMSLVDEIKILKKSDAALFHLKYPANMTRHVQPMYLQKRTHPPLESDTCVTVGVDKNENTRSIFLKAVLHNCPDNRRCYKNVYPKKCTNETSTSWSGTVVCYGCSGWYPAAVYHKEAGPCSFTRKQSLSSIDYINTNLITGMHETLQPITIEPECNGFRCPLGECIKWNKACDGIPHCRNGEDEEVDYCQKMKDHCANSVDAKIGCHCAQSELRCGNGQCVPKSSFCDGQVDCDDGTDEPSRCSCAAYLKLTSPNLICDGRRHCLDKSDESPDLCLCKDAGFKCDQRGDICIPQDFVCDGESDCPSGDDEKHCQSLKSLSSDTLGYGEVIQRSHGVWHSQCFPAGALSGSEGTDLCTNFGYSYAKNITESDISSPKNSPVVPVLDKFYMIRLNRQTWIALRDDKPLVSLHPSKETCYRHYVTCV